MEQQLSGHSARDETLSDEHSADRSASRNKTGDREFDADDLRWGEFSDWMQLVRLPNVFTLLSDCVAAAIVASGLAWNLLAFLPVLIASLLAYWAGMILNDVVDLEEDREHRPDRPLASGRISPVIAGHVATGMLLIGPLVILAALTFQHSQQLWMGIAFMASVLLSLAVRAYDSPIKRTPLGPPLMGVCRGLNILMVGFAMLAITHATTGDGDAELVSNSAKVVEKLLTKPLLP
ncbi:MAG: UbiA family prenyltransferase, partial [Aureliella sp.]